MPHPAARDAEHRPRAGDDELAHLVARNDQLEAENASLRAEGERQQERIAALERKVEELRRKAKRQAAPFSREKPKRDPGRPGRRPGADYGKRAHRPAPGRRRQGRHRLQTSDALGAAASMLGPGAVALATQLGKELGLSPAKVSQLFGEQFGISITPGGVVGAITRQARVLEPTYAALVEGVRASSVVAPDETGWRVEGSKAWHRRRPRARRLGAECRHLQWPQGRHLNWPHLLPVVGWSDCA